MDCKTIVVMEGDQTGQGLLEESLRVLDAGVTALDLEFKRYDLSLENRRATDNEVVHEAAAAMREPGFGKEDASRVSRAIYEATFEAVLDGTKTADLGGSAGTTEFTDEVIRHVKNKLEVWSALA